MTNPQVQRRVRRPRFLGNVTGSGHRCQNQRSRAGPRSQKSACVRCGSALAPPALNVANYPEDSAIASGRSRCHFILVQQVPKPLIHAVLSLGILVNLEYVGGIVFEEPRNPNELQRKRSLLVHKGWIVENQFHCRQQARRIGYYGANFVKFPFLDGIGSSHWRSYLASVSLIYSDEIDELSKSFLRSPGWQHLLRRQSTRDSAMGYVCTRNRIYSD